MVAFSIGGLFILAVLLLVGGQLSTSPPIGGVVAFAGAVLGLTAMLAAALGLAYGRPWAAAVATPMLVLLVIGGAIEFVVAFTRNSINIPIGALLALWALRAPLRTPPDAETGTRPWRFAGAAVVVAMLLSTGWPLVTAVLLGTGGPFIVDESALAPSLGITCDGEPGTPPTAVHIRYDWRWTRAELLASGIDTVTLAAFGLREDGDPAFALDETEHSSVGTWQSDVMIDEPTGIVFGIDLGQAGFEPGSVGIGLIPFSETPDAHGRVDIRAVYLHGPTDTSSANSTALWRVVTEGHCAW